MKIAIVATYDVTDVNNWSGTAAYIYNLLNNHYDVTPIKVDFKRPLSSWIKGYYYNRIAGKRYFVTFDKAVHKKSRPMYKAKLDKGFDIILTYDYFLIPQIAPYTPNAILFTDATFDNLLNYYDYRTNLCPSNIKEGHILQKEAFEVLKYAVLSSEWAKDNAINRYGARSEQFIDIKYGSNLKLSLDENLLEDTIDKRLSDKTIKLFFPMVYWERKGGEFVLQIMEKLHALGMAAELIVAGKVPDNLNESYIDYVGYLNKKVPEQEEKMIDQYMRSHFLIMPSKADCTPIAFSEANSFALPVISTKTGGIESVVNPKFDNGVCFHLDDDYADKVVKYISDTLKTEDRYRTLCRNAYHTYHDHFEWKNAEKILIDMVESLK